MRHSPSLQDPSGREQKVGKRIFTKLGDDVSWVCPGPRILCPAHLKNWLEGEWVWNLRPWRASQGIGSETTSWEKQEAPARASPLLLAQDDA